MSNVTALVRKAALVAAPFAMLTLGACATPFQANVQRFQQMPVPQGQSFSVTSDDPELARGLEFQHYAGLVSEQLTRLGYSAAADGSSGDLVVKISYGVDKGRERVRRDPFYDPYWGDPFYGRPYSPYYGRYRGYYGPSRYMWGWNDPFLYGSGWGSGVERYTIYKSQLNMQIERASTKERVFEGTAEAISRDDDLTHLVPNLVDALFTGFPGNSGERVRISVAPKKEG